MNDDLVRVNEVLIRGVVEGGSGGLIPLLKIMGDFKRLSPLSLNIFQTG